MYDQPREISVSKSTNSYEWVWNDKLNEVMNDGQEMET